ncbi:hypothetical protein [Ectopseudomonas oleovorans]|uniref:hypothetical protein n=1 Tax=Ectopseudomonas oleovorans TaxID=301 RepID=UPI0035B35D68
MQFPRGRFGAGRLAGGSFSPGGCLLGSRHLRTKLFGLPLQVLDELIGFSCGLCLEFALLLRARDRASRVVACRFRILASSVDLGVQPPLVRRSALAGDAALFLVNRGDLNFGAESRVSSRGLTRIRSNLLEPTRTIP